MQNRESSARPGLFVALLGLALCLLLAAAPADTQAQGALEIYFIDVEGGGATLFVSPSGESLLIDTGNGGQNASRDAGRIMDVLPGFRLDRCFSFLASFVRGCLSFPFPSFSFYTQALVIPHRGPLTAPPHFPFAPESDPLRQTRRIYQ